MRSVGLLLITTLCINAYDYALSPKKVGENIYCFFGKPEVISKQNGGNIVNSCYVMTPKGYVVIDSGPTYQYASQTYQAMQKIAPLEVKYTIVTHEHDDHWLGNSYFKSKNATIIGPKTYEQNIASHTSKMKTEDTRMAKYLSKETLKKTSIVPLDIVVDQTPYSFALGGETFTIKRLVSKAHTSGDLVVLLSKNRAIFVGDIVFNDRITSMRDGSIIGNLDAIDLIDQSNVDFVITGHGTIVTKDATKRQKAYLTQMKDKVLQAIDEGVGIEKINTLLKLEEFANDKLYKELHKLNVLSAYSELEMYEEEE